jgi:hypothetical protein
MTKQRRYFEQVAEYKERFRKLPSDTIRSRLASGPLIKEAAIRLPRGAGGARRGGGPGRNG